MKFKSQNNKEDIFIKESKSNVKIKQNPELNFKTCSLRFIVNSCTKTPQIFYWNSKNERYVINKWNDSFNEPHRSLVNCKPNKKLGQKLSIRTRVKVILI